MIIKNSRMRYLFGSVVTLLATIMANFITYLMVHSYLEKPDIFHYYRGGLSCFLLSAPFLVAFILGTRCFIRNKATEYHITIKINNILKYYGIIIILMIPFIGFFATNKIISDGYIRCESRPYSIEYAKNENDCKKYKNRNNPKAYQ